MTDDEINLYDDDDMVDVAPLELNDGAAELDDASVANGNMNEGLGTSTNLDEHGDNEVHAVTEGTVSAYSMHGGLETCALLVSEMTWWTTDLDLENTIQSDALKKVVFDELKVNGKSRGRAYVEFKTIEASRNAMEKLRNTPIHGKELAVQYTTVTHGTNLFGRSKDYSSNSGRVSRMNSIGSSNSAGAMPHNIPQAANAMGMPGVPMIPGFPPAPPFGWPGQNIPFVYPGGNFHPHRNPPGIGVGGMGNVFPGMPPRPNASQENRSHRRRSRSPSNYNDYVNRGDAPRIKSARSKSPRNQSGRSRSPPSRARSKSPSRRPRSRSPLPPRPGSSRDEHHRRRDHERSRDRARIRRRGSRSSSPAPPPPPRRVSGSNAIGIRRRSPSSPRNQRKNDGGGRRRSPSPPRSQRSNANIRRRSPSPPRNQRNNDGGGRRRSPSPPRGQRSNANIRRRSPSPPRNQRKNDGGGRRRSPSPPRKQRKNDGDSSRKRSPSPPRSQRSNVDNRRRSRSPLRNQRKNDDSGRRRSRSPPTGQRSRHDVPSSRGISDHKNDRRQQRDDEQQSRRRKDDSTRNRRPEEPSAKKPRPEGRHKKGEERTESRSKENESKEGRSKERGTSRDRSDHQKSGGKGKGHEDESKRTSCDDSTSSKKRQPPAPIKTAGRGGPVQQPEDIETVELFVSPITPVESRRGSVVASESRRK